MTLGDVLRRLDRLGGRTPGPATWRIDGDGELVIEWKGGAEVVPVQGEQRLSFQVPAGSMRALAQTIAKSGTCAFGLHPDGRVSIDGMFLKHRPVDADAPQNLLPVQASPFDVLMLAYTRDAETIATAGVSAEVEEVRRKLVASIEEAARDLAWTRVTPALLGKWIEAHLASVAQGEDSFVP